MWTDAGQQHDMVLFRQATAWVDHYRSLAGDDADEREQPGLPDGPPLRDAARTLQRRAVCCQACPLDRIPRRRSRCARSTSARAGHGANGSQIAAEERPQLGFRVCRAAAWWSAARQTRMPAAAQTPHKRPVRYQSSAASGTPTCIARSPRRRCASCSRCPRCWSTRSSRPSRPASTWGCAASSAAIPTTCRLCRISEPASDGTKRRYLVIFDTVPGGTSFLRDLARPTSSERAGAGARTR